MTVPTGPSAISIAYDFRIGGEPVGTYTLTDDGETLTQHVSFAPPEGGHYENRHEVRYATDRVTAFRVGDGPWVDCSPALSDHYPSAAFPILLRHGITSYHCVDEDTGSITERTLTAENGRIVEREAARVTRSFVVEGDRIIEIDWGAGASSTLLG